MRSTKEGKPQGVDTVAFDPRMLKSEALRYVILVSCVSYFTLNFFRLDGEVILVRVGTAGAEVFIHQNLVCESSMFFRSMLTHKWKESADRIVLLPYDDPITFNVYAEWKYTGKILSSIADQDDTNQEEWLHLVQAYILGDKLQDGPFKDAVLDSIIAKSNVAVNGFHYFPIQNITTFIYANTIPNSPLRRLLVDQHVFHGRASWMEGGSVNDVDKEFLFDLCVSLLQHRPQPPGLAPDKVEVTCMYHEHDGTGSNCYKTKKPLSVICVCIFCLTPG